MAFRSAEPGFPVIASLSPDRRGPAPETPGIRRILCLKLDHIGDVLIAAPALMLLRRSFPQAHITLVCGPWNVGLARRLKVADEIVPAAIFSQVSLADLDPAARAERRDTAVAELQARGLGPFDLAIDLRRDDDTREILKLFQARAYVGFGDLATFSYLDVALPFTRHGVHEGASSLRLGPAELDGGGMGHLVTEDGLHLTAQAGRLDLTVSTDAVWPPTDEGTPDTRLLGTAVYRLDIRTRAASGELAAPAELTRDHAAFGPGWLEPEPWGRWSSVADAPITLSFSTAGADVELLVRVQGHTAAPHPRANVRLSTPDAEVGHAFNTGEEPVTLALACRAQLSPPVARSEPVLLRPGRYQGVLRLKLADPSDWERLSVVVRSARMAQVLARLVLPETVDQLGVLDFPFEFHHRDGAEPVVVEIRSEGSGGARGPGVLAVELECQEARAPLLPLGHMEGQLMDLAAMTALRFAPRLVTPDGEVERALSEPVEGSTATAAVERLRARRGGKRLFGLVNDERRLIGVGIGANKDSKRWPQPYFLDLCRRLLARRGVDIVFIGGPKEAEEVKALAAELHGGERVIDLCSACRIEDLGEVLAELDGYIGLDTGTTHFAGRVGVKTLALFGASHDPAEWGPVGGRSGWAAVQVPCGSCFKSELSECDFGLRCMTLLTPKEVWRLVEARLL